MFRFCLSHLQGLLFVASNIYTLTILFETRVWGFLAILDLYIVALCTTIKLWYGVLYVAGRCCCSASESMKCDPVWDMSVVCGVYFRPCCFVFECP
jgi:hypothetical protein